MPNWDLDERLRWRELDASDLGVLLGSSFGMSRLNSGDRVVEYFRDGQHMLSLRFRANLSVDALEPGLALTEEAVSELAARIAQIRESVDVRIQRRLLYARAFVDGYRRYDGLLGRVQMLPPPAHAPDVQAVMGDHPVVLEYPLTWTGITMVDHARRERMFRRYALAFSGLVTQLDVPERQRQLWARVPGSDPRSIGQTIWTEAAYWVGGPVEQAVPGWRADFSPLDGLAPLAVLPDDEYHDQRGKTVDEHLAVPDSLAASLDLLAGLRTPNSLRCCGGVASR
jgi:hypothetical protein